MTKPYKAFKSLFEYSGVSLNAFAKSCGFFDVRFITNWKEIVGEELGGKCTPCKLVYDNFTKTAVLFISTQDLSFKALFTHYKTFILNKVKLYFGISFITEVKLVRI